MASQLEELVSFLHSPQPAVRQIALDNLVGFSTGPTAKIFKYDNYRAIEDLIELSKEKSKLLVQQSITILANLCDDITIRKLIVKNVKFLEYLSWKICDLNNTGADIMCILLSNLSKEDEVTQLFQFDRESTSKENNKILSKLDREFFKSTKIMDCLMDCFVKGYDRQLNKYANYDYLSYFFADISRFRKGREYFITKQKYDEVIPISKLLVFTEKYDSKTRREGVASTIKNSLFDNEMHMKLLSDQDINLLPFILLPLASGNEDEMKLDDEDMFKLPDELQLLDEEKKRDPEVPIICNHLESILLLSTTKDGREFMRNRSVYPVVRELHKNLSDNDDIDELCNRIVNVLMRGEVTDDKVEELMSRAADDEGESKYDSDEEDDDAIVEVI